VNLSRPVFVMVSAGFESAEKQLQSIRFIIRPKILIADD